MSSLSRKFHPELSTADNGSTSSFFFILGGDLEVMTTGRKEHLFDTRAQFPHFMVE